MYPASCHAWSQLLIISAVVAQVHALQATEDRALPVPMRLTGRLHCRR